MQLMIKQWKGTGIESAGDVLCLLVFTSLKMSASDTQEKYLNSGMEGTSVCRGVYGRVMLARFIFKLFQQKTMRKVRIHHSFWNEAFHGFCSKDSSLFYRLSNGQRSYRITSYRRT